MVDGHTVRYALISQQPTTLGEFNGRSSERVRGLARAFKAAGFPTTISGDMGWVAVKAHAFFVTAVSGAIYLVGGDCRRLSEDSAALTFLMAKGVREGFVAVRALGRTVTPFPLRVLFAWMPQWLADYVFGRHARSASHQMREIASDCLTLLEKTGVKKPRRSISSTKPSRSMRCEVVCSVGFERPVSLPSTICNIHFTSTPAVRNAQIAAMSGRRPVVKGCFEAVVNASGAVMSTAC